MLEVVVRRQSRSDVERDTQLGLALSLFASVVGGTVVVSSAEANATTLATTATMTTGNNDAKSLTGAVGTRRRAVGLVFGDGIIIFISWTSHCLRHGAWWAKDYEKILEFQRWLERGKIKCGNIPAILRDEIVHGRNSNKLTYAFHVNRYQLSNFECQFQNLKSCSFLFLEVLWIVVSRHIVASTATCIF
jgi:hypothetical protein